jgi:ribosomal protein S14
VFTRDHTSLEPFSSKRLSESEATEQTDDATLVFIRRLTKGLALLQLWNRDEQKETQELLLYPLSAESVQKGRKPMKTKRRCAICQHPEGFIYSKLLDWHLCSTCHDTTMRLYELGTLRFRNGPRNTVASRRSFTKAAVKRERFGHPNINMRDVSL